MPKIKICGITNYSDGKFALDCGVDALGFNFYRGSPRYVEPDRALEIIERIPEGVWRVGVFVNAGAEEIEKILAYVPLDTLQFSGDESIEFISRWPDRRIVKAVRVRGALEESELRTFSEIVDHLLLDRFDPLLFGGTGEEISAKDLALLSRQGILEKAFLAGGITPENVREKIETYRPYGIDVASGVEEAPGKKNKEKVKALVEAVRGALPMLSS